MADEIIVKVRADVDGFKSDMDEAKKIGNSAIQEIEKNSIDLKVDTKSTESLRTQMRKAQQEVAELSMKFGATSKAAIDAAKRASELKDAIGDAKALTDAFSPDAKFKALSGSLQGVVGGFTAVQGAIGAFGTKSEEVEQALLKVNSAMALSQGLQSVGESVDSFKNLGAVIKSTTAFQFLYNAATATATAVQTAFGVATTATSTGFKVLRGAIMATGIGALVVGLGLVISNFDAISSWIKSSPLGSLASGVGRLVEQFTDFVGITSEAQRNLEKMTNANARANESLNGRIKLLKAQGGSEKEIYKLSKEVIENNLNDIRNASKVKGSLSTEDQKKMRELKTEEIILTAEYNKKISDDNAKANEERLKKQKEASDKSLKIREEYQKNLEDLIRKGRDAESADIQKLVDENQKAIQEIENDRLGAEESELRAVDDKYFELITKAELYNGKSKALEDAVANFTNRKEKEKADIQAKYLKEREDAEKKQADYQAKLNEQSTKTFEEEEAKKVALLKEKFDLINQFASNGILLQIGLNPQDVNRLSASIKSITDKIAEGKPIDAAQVAETAGNAYFAVSNAIANDQKQKTAQELEELKTKQDEELRLAGDNEQKKEIIRQKYAIKEREVKRRQAEADKRKAILDATVNTAVAIVKTFATMGFLAGLVPAALMAALGAAQIALIAAQPIPKFAKGGAVPSSDIKGMIDGRPHASGGVLIEAEGNEFITRKAQAMKPENLGLLEAINMSDSERDAYLNAHYIKPALEAKESKAKESYQRSMIEAENNLIARISSNTLRNIHGELKNNTEAVKKLSKNNYSW
jgi:hypothetical protein